MSIPSIPPRRRVLAGALSGVVVTVAGCGRDDGPAAARVTGGRYATAFELVEEPISEHAHWQHRGRDWTMVRSGGGRAHGTQTNATYAYNDSYAYLAGFPPDHSAEAVIYNDSSNGINKEVELLLRWSDSRHRAQGYEVNIQHAGRYAQVVRWNGRLGSFKEIARANSVHPPRSGDRYRAGIRGSVITVYLNDVEIMRATDSTWMTGQPGIGFFVEPGASNAEFGFSSFAATAL